jgi:hypothetical protein
MRRLWVAWFLIVGGAVSLVLGVGSGFRGLHNTDGEACPALFDEERLVSVLSGRDLECDPTHRAQRAFVERTVGSGAVGLVAGGVLWGTRNVRRRPFGAPDSRRAEPGHRESGAPPAL